MPGWICHVKVQNVKHRSIYAASSTQYGGTDELLCGFEMTGVNAAPRLFQSIKGFLEDLPILQALEFFHR
jgi:hypothetical protein